MSNSYNQRLYQQETVLTVGTVQTPGLIQLNGEDWEGPIVELLRAIARKIPWIRAIKIVAETTSNSLLSTGQVAVDITPNILCVQENTPQVTPGFAYLAINKPSKFMGTLIYVTNLPHPQLQICSNCTFPLPPVYCPIEEPTTTPTNVLSVLASNSSDSFISFYANDELATIAATCGGYSGSSILPIITLPTINIPAIPNPATPSSILSFFLSPYVSTCRSVLYLDQALTPAEIAAINEEAAAEGTPGLMFGYITPTSATLIYTWTFNSYASQLQLWFQFAFDQVVASGEYDRIIKNGGLNMTNTNSSPVFLPVLSFVSPRPLYSINNGFLPRSLLYETLLPKLFCYRNSCQVLALETDECEEEVMIAT